MSDYVLTYRLVTTDLVSGLEHTDSWLLVDQLSGSFVRVVTRGGAFAICRPRTNEKGEQGSGMSNVKHAERAVGPRVSMSVPDKETASRFTQVEPT